jgi:hypothetical protein
MAASTACGSGGSGGAHGSAGAVVATGSPGAVAATASAGDGSCRLGPGPVSCASPEQLTAAAGSDSCKVVTKADVVKAFGRPFRDAEPTLDSRTGQLSRLTGTNDGCTYWSTAERSGGVDEVSVAVARGPSAASLYAQVADYYGQKGTRHDVAGIGDHAFITGLVLYVLKGQAIVELGVGGIDFDQAEPPLRTVAKVALGRL